ncbi:type I restriction enzyme, S subunit [Ruminococcaceae bacterium FB2012]|nr:type I restriction enzyme, S subunit [Ruminococcaceae bacterium FB2012]
MTAQQLKNSILQMAVQGKLVPQDPNDEPASVLLQRIIAEKQELIKAGKIQKDKNASEIFRGASRNLPYAYYEQIGKEIRDISDEIPFDIPDSWEWCRLKNIVNAVSARRVHQSDWKTSGIPFYRAREIAKLAEDGIVENELFISRELFDDYSKSGVPTSGDLMVTAVGTLGKTYIVKDTDEFYYKDASVICLENYGKISPEYLKYLIMSPYMETTIKDNSSGTTVGTITLVRANEYLFPIPPLPEQYRIVAKIEELLPYIEKYDTAETKLSALNTTFPETLKKSILQEAVQGKLVPQDPDDEPASVLLERIRAEKQALIKAGKIKKDKHESVIVTRDKIPYEIIDGKERYIADEVPFELPESWCWCRLGDILLKLTDGTHSTPKYTEKGVPFISVKDVSAGKLDFSNCKHISEKEHTELYERCNPEFGDILLTKVGTTGIPVIVDTDKQFSLFVSVALLKFNQELLYNKYLLYMINSPLVQKQATENTKGVGNKNWVMRDIANTLIAIPPLAEQHRIVAKIEELLPVISTISK